LEWSERIKSSSLVVDQSRDPHTALLTYTVMPCQSGVPAISSILIQYTVYIGLVETVTIHHIWLYIWWFPCQKYLINTARSGQPYEFVFGVTPIFSRAVTHILTLVHINCTHYVVKLLKRSFNKCIQIWDHFSFTLKPSCLFPSSPTFLLFGPSWAHAVCIFLDQRTKGPKNQRTKGPKDQRTKGPAHTVCIFLDQRTKGPKDQRTKGPKDQRTKGLKDQRTKGPAHTVCIFLDQNALSAFMWRDVCSAEIYIWGLTHHWQANALACQWVCKTSNIYLNTLIWYQV